MNNEEMPNDYESEQAILGAIIYDNKKFSVVNSIIKNAGYFYEKPHQNIFIAMLELRDNETPIDMVTLSVELKRTNSLDAAGGPSYIALLDTCVPSSGNVAHYSKIIAEKYHLRKFISITGESAIAGKESGQKSSELIDGAIDKLLKLRTSLSSSAKAISVFDSMLEIIDGIDLVRTGKALSGIPTGFSEFDRMLGGGPQNGDLIFIGAEPSTGKTSLGICLSYSLTMSKKKGIIFSLESSRESIIRDRLIPAAIEIDSHKLRYGDLKDDKWDRIYKLAGDDLLKDLKICDESSINVNDIYSIISMEHMSGGVDYVLIDYAQLINPVRNTGNRNNDLGETARGLKRINKDFNIPIIVLSQLNKAGDLRDSGELLQVADVEIILKKSEEMENIVGCDFRKNRNGIRGSINFTFIPEYTKFITAR